jgi:uncharacterized protein
MNITAMLVMGGIPVCRSLKEKRGRLKPVLSGLRREFGLSTAEVGNQEDWDSFSLACVIVSSDFAHNDEVLQNAVTWIENRHLDLVIQQYSTEHR